MRARGVSDENRETRQLIYIILVPGDFNNSKRDRDALIFRLVK